MVSSVYLLSYLISCFLIIQICSSMVISDRYSSSYDYGLDDELDRESNDDEVFVSQRAAHFVFPPTAFIYPSNKVVDLRDFHPIKRQSFGRKHHWDAFFGRR